VTVGMWIRVAELKPGMPRAPLLSQLSSPRLRHRSLPNIKHVLSYIDFILSSMLRGVVTALHHGGPS
jgi:hypothetical protein